MIGKKILSICIIALSTVQAGISLGRCPLNITTKANFNETRYLGTWYEMMRDKVFPMEQGSKCGTETYTAGD